MDDYIYRPDSDMHFCCGGVRIRTDDRNVFRMYTNVYNYHAFYQGYLDELFGGGFPELRLPDSGSVLETINDLNQLLNDLQPGAVNGAPDSSITGDFMFVTLEECAGALGWGIRTNFYRGDTKEVLRSDVITDFALWDISTADYSTSFETIYPVSRADFFGELALTVGYDRLGYPIKFDVVWLCCMAAKNSYVNMMWYSGLNRVIREMWGATSHKKGRPLQRRLPGGP